MGKDEVRRFSAKLVDFLKGLLILIVIAYIAYSVGMSVYKNYQTNQQIEELKAEITGIKQEIDELNNLIVYYRSDSFKELEARRRLGLRGKDEQVVILPKPEERPKEEVKVEGSSQNSASNNQSNILNWYQFIFGK